MLSKQQSIEERIKSQWGQLSLCPNSRLILFSSDIVVVQSLSCVRLFATPWTAAHQDSLSFTISQSLLKLTSIESVMPSNQFILCCPLFLLPSIFPSIRVFQFSSVAQSCPTLWTHGLQHARLPCPSPAPRACSDSYPSSWWCLPTTSSSVIPFSSCLQSFPASGSFPMSQLLISGGWNIGISASVLPMNIQDWFPLGLTGWISLQSKGLSRVFSNTTVQKHQCFGTQPSPWSNSYIHTWPLEKP